MQPGLSAWVRDRVRKEASSWVRCRCESTYFRWSNMSRSCTRTLSASSNASPTCPAAWRSLGPAWRTSASSSPTLWQPTSNASQRRRNVSRSRDRCVRKLHSAPGPCRVSGEDRPPPLACVVCLNGAGMATDSLQNP